jgi:hypothetical protein
MTGARASLSTFGRLPWRDRLLLAEAMWWLTLASAAIAVLPFRRIGPLAMRPVRGPEPPPQLQKTTIRRVRWAIEACARRVPWQAACFQQGLAAQFMLRRRGIASVLYYGAAPDDTQGLSAHVWVEAAGAGVVGHKTAHQFAVLVRYPGDQ